MFIGYGEDPDKVATINNIITMVRAAQKNNVAIDYDGIIKNVEAQGPGHPEVPEVKALLYSLRDTNPYK